MRRAPPWGSYSPPPETHLARKPQPGTPRADRFLHTVRVPASRSLPRFPINPHHRVEMERMKGEVRDREKVMRGLKRMDTPILKGTQIYHNFVKSHQDLQGRTPAEAAGIEVEGENKWLTLIQNASKVVRTDDTRSNQQVYAPIHRIPRCNRRHNRSDGCFHAATLFLPSILFPFRASSS